MDVWRVTSNFVNLDQTMLDGTEFKTACREGFLLVDVFFQLILRMLSSVPRFAPHPWSGRCFYLAHVCLVFTSMYQSFLVNKLWYDIQFWCTTLPPLNPRINVALLGQFWGENHMPSSGQSAYFSYEYLQILSASLIYCFIILTDCHVALPH